MLNVFLLNFYEITKREGEISYIFTLDKYVKNPLLFIYKSISCVDIFAVLRSAPQLFRR